MSERDTLRRFIFEQSAIRGEWVHLDTSWKELSGHTDYPDAVKKVLGEAMAAVALLAATIKFGGSLTLQITGSGYISMLVMQATDERALRGTAHWDEGIEGEPVEMFSEDTRLVMTLDPGEGKERYQGVVALEGDSIASALEDYFERSEQLSTRIWLASSADAAAGMLLQRMPDAGKDDDENWARLNMLTDTVRNDELLTLESGKILYRLYHEEALRVFDGEAIVFGCRCSREKVSTVIIGLGHQEADSMLINEGSIEVQCEFCSEKYVFDPVDVEGLFRGASAAGVSTRNQ